uniref:B-cell receptor CD22 n=1 Tax=Dicentrarchus labrax TaxID=13489 RepID=A0A8C4HF95_DICLA
STLSNQLKLLIVIVAPYVLCVTVVQCENDWGVTYTSTEICALKGSTVDISCTYIYPSRIKGRNTKVEKKVWFTRASNNLYVDIKTDPEYSGRVQYICGNNDCTLRITDLRESDSAEYKFRFITNQPGGRYFGRHGITLSVTDLQVQVSRLLVYESHNCAELKCHSSCRLPDHLHYVWYKNGQKIQGDTSYFYSNNASCADSYSCAVEGHEKFPSPPLYAPRVPSVSVSPSGEIVEGSSVNLTCSSDANPEATYTWYKRNGHRYLELPSKEPQHVFRSIQSSDSGEYYCTAENELGRTSAFISINVKYAPRVPSVSVSPSGEIVEGSSVNLTCSSDANPAATYNWYKEDEDSPKASGQIFTITDIRPEHSGNYYCEAQNRRGRHNSTLYLTIVAVSPVVWKLAVIGTALGVFLVIIWLSVFLLLRKKRTSKRSSEPGERPEDRCLANQEEEQDDLHYASVHFSNNQADPVYANIRPAGPRRHKEEEEEVVEYAAVKFNRAITDPRTGGPETDADPSALYSTVNRTV